MGASEIPSRRAYLPDSVAGDSERVQVVRTMRTALAIALLMMAACGDEGPTSPLDGHWTITYSRSPCAGTEVVELDIASYTDKLCEGDACEEFTALDISSPTLGENLPHSFDPDDLDHVSIDVNVDVDGDTFNDFIRLRLEITEGGTAHADVSHSENGCTSDDTGPVVER